MSLYTVGRAAIRRWMLKGAAITRSSPRVNLLIAAPLFVAFAVQPTISAAQPSVFGQIGPPKCDPPTPPLFVCRKGPATCKAGQWAPGLPLPAGTACLVGGREGNCSASQVCVGLPPGKSGNFSPRYLLLAVTYSPVGNDSTTAYTVGNAVGSVNSLSHALGNGVTVTATGEGIYVSVGWSLTTQYGTQYTFTKQTSETLGTLPNPSPTPGSDGVDHTQDVFWVWLNPQMHYNQQYADVLDVNINFLAQQPAIIARPITAAQVMGRAPDFEGIMTGWTAADKANLLNQDPFLTSGYQLDTKRFDFVQEVIVHGPSAPGAAIPYTAVAVNYSGQHCSQDQVASTSTVSVGADASITLFAKTELQVYGTLTNTETWSKSKCDQLSQTLMWTPASTTYPYSHRVDVYMDKTFGTLAYLDMGPDNAASPESATLAGTVTGLANEAMKFRQVDLVLPNGLKRTLVTDENGKFQTSIPAGADTIKSGAATSRVTLERGKTTIQVLRIAAELRPTERLPRRDRVAHPEH